MVPLVRGSAPARLWKLPSPAVQTAPTVTVPPCDSAWVGLAANTSYTVSCGPCFPAIQSIAFWAVAPSDSG